jgi:hypothetical protein
MLLITSGLLILELHTSSTKAISQTKLDHSWTRFNEMSKLPFTRCLVPSIAWAVTNAHCITTQTHKFEIPIVSPNDVWTIPHLFHYFWHFFIFFPIFGLFFNKKLIKNILCDQKNNFILLLYEFYYYLQIAIPTFPKFIIFLQKTPL